MPTDTSPLIKPCGCRACRPDHYPSGPRENEGHIGARFGDFETGNAFYARAYLDGREVCAFEACPGMAGYVVMPHGAERNHWWTHQCPCGADNCCEVVRYGVVRIEWKGVR